MVDLYVQSVIINELELFSRSLPSGRLLILQLSISAQSSMASSMGWAWQPGIPLFSYWVQGVQCWVLGLMQHAFNSYYIYTIGSTLISSSIQM